MERTRTFTWNDPLTGARRAQELSGLEYLNAMCNGELPLPPLMHTLDLKIGSLREGEAVFSFVPQEFHYNPIGSVHGGVITAILDSAMGCTIHSLLPAGTAYTTLELKVNFLKAVGINSGELRAVGKIIHSGKKTALVEAQLLDQNNTVYAHAVSTCLIFTIKTEK